ncbi:hypothetical protein BDZ89DRAFT_1148432 [Hymenopellis radicata]|nr:hypothetical protein BDZ89DRAFT_1148432 [Hymenopellis radicata]
MLGGSAPPRYVALLLFIGIWTDHLTQLPSSKPPRLLAPCLSISHNVELPLLGQIYERSLNCLERPISLNGLKTSRDYFDTRRPVLFSAQNLKSASSLSQFDISARPSPNDEIPEVSTTPLIASVLSSATGTVKTTPSPAPGTRSVRDGFHYGSTSALMKLVQVLRRTTYVSPKFGGSSESRFGCRYHAQDDILTTPRRRSQTDEEDGCARPASPPMEWSRIPLGEQETLICTT